MDNTELISKIMITLGEIEIKSKYAMQMAGVLDALNVLREDLKKGDKDVSAKT